MKRADQERLLDRLWDWSMTIDPGYRPQPEELEDLKAVALAYLGSPDVDWLAVVKDYSEQYCFPPFDLAKASALYLFFRVVFDLPADLLRHQAKNFGGWLHPSIPVVGQPKPVYFNLSWPVEIRKDTQTLVIHPFEGYFGKGYDAIGEYYYFLKNFSHRDRNALEQVDFVYSLEQIEEEAGAESPNA